MSAGHPLTEEQRRQIHAMRAAGVPARAVAKALDLHPSTVWRAVPMGHKCRPAAEVMLIQELRYLDGFTVEQTARIAGCSLWAVQRYAPGQPGKVPIAPLREAFLSSPMTATEVARELGWWDHRGNADSGRVKRTLGINHETSHGRRYRRSLVDAETVQLIAEAIGVAPWSVLPDDDMVAVA